MIIRQFLAWTQHSSAGRRAEAASALARAYLHANLGPEAAWEAKTAILALLDDPSPLVRRALAEACAGSERTPRPLAVALASDQPEIAGLILQRSPVLTDADLVDAAAMGCEAARSAIARRHHLPHTVSGALAEIAAPATLAVLAGNATAQITTGRLLRMVERHGTDAGLREALLSRADLPLEVRHAVAAGLARSLSGFVTQCGWLSPERAERMSREAGERAVLDLCAGAPSGAILRVVRHLRAAGQLNAGLILRAVLSEAMAFTQAALADLAGIEPNRAEEMMRDARGFAALHRRAGLPEALLPAFAAALDAWREAQSGGSTASGAALSRRMIERALTACETMPFAEAQGLMALLTRYEVEAAREEAREMARALAEPAEPIALDAPPLWVPDHAEPFPEAAAPRAVRETVLAEIAAPILAEPVVQEIAPPVIAQAATEDLDLTAVDAVFDTLLDSYRAGREPPATSETEADEVRIGTFAPREEATAAETIPEALVASYRPERLRLAA